MGGLAVASALLLWWLGALETAEAATLIVTGLGLASLRHGLTTERVRLLLELAAPYRPQTTGEQASPVAGATGLGLEKGKPEGSV